jgi:hypothetical protein
VKFEEALKVGKGFTLMEVNVSAGSKESGICGYNEWRKAIELKVKSPAREGKANREIIKEMEKLFGTRVELIRGVKSSNKTLKIYEEYVKVVEVLRDVLK